MRLLTWRVFRWDMLIVYHRCSNHFTSQLVEEFIIKSLVFVRCCSNNHWKKWKHPLLEGCLYFGFFWSVFLRIRTEYGDLLCKSSHSVGGKIRIRKPPNMNTCHTVVVIHLTTRSLDGNLKTTDILEYFRKR